MQHYVALIHKDAGTDFGASFPDFPGCVSAGATMQEAVEGAEEALRGHMSLLVEEGEPIPEPSTLDHILLDPEAQLAQAVFVRAPAISQKTVRVNITLYEDVLMEITAFAEANGQTRSGFLVSAARQVMMSAPIQNPVYYKGRSPVSKNNVVPMKRA